METTALLVKQEDLQRHLAEVTLVEREVVEDLTKILPFIKNATLKSSLEKRLRQGQDCLEALDAGFVPVAAGYFTRVDTKSKWQKRWVREALNSMPPEVEEVWEKVRAKGIFDTFSVTTGGGDPVLVGNKGRKHFFIAGWLPITPGVGIGLRIKV